MEYNPRKPGLGLNQDSKEPPRGIKEGFKSGRVAATALGTASKDHVHRSGDALKRSHDHVKSTEKEPSRLSKDHVKLKELVTTPQLKAKVNVDRNSLSENLGRTQVLSEKVRPKLKDAIERDILNQSLKRTQGGQRPKVVHKVKDEKEMEILKESLKRTQDIKLQQRGKDVREGYVLNESQRRTQVLGSEVSKGRHEKPKEPLKSKSVVRAGDGMRTSTNAGIEKAEKKESACAKDSLEGKSVTRPTVVEDLKKIKLPSDGKRPAEDGKVVKVRTATKIIEPIRNVSKVAPRTVKLVTTSAIKVNQEKQKKKSFSLPGQRFETPEERDALRLFYGSLHRQIPTSDMANIWLMEHGLLETDEAQKVLTQKVKSKGNVTHKASSYHAPTPSKFSNGSAGRTSKFQNDSFLDAKPVSKKLKL